VSLSGDFKYNIYCKIYPISINIDYILRYIVTIRKGGTEFSHYIQEGDKVERIYRVLLSIRGISRSWYRIAKDADVSYGWAYSILKGLERDGLIDGHKVIQPKALFMRWVERKDLRLFREYNVQDLDDVIAKSELDHVFTGYFAENLIGRYLFPRYREFYVKKEDALKWHQLLTGQGYVGRGNAQIILADDHVFFERQCIDKHPLVSTQQLIVDLYRTGAECAEAADLLVSKVYQ